MCGILAIARSSPPSERDPLVSTRALDLAMQRLRLRGPDGEGAWRSRCGRLLLAHTRLAIQDPSVAGRQPMTDAPSPSDRDERVVITFNGEIYNAPALRIELERGGFAFRSQSDTEVLLHGFIAWGIDRLLARILGMFAFVIADLREGAPIFHAANDPTGMKPLVWSFSPASQGESGGRLAIASDCDSLAAALADDPRFSKRLEAQALCHVLSIGYCPAPLTMWRGVYKLAPGRKMTWRVGDAASPRIDPYWSPPEQIDQRLAADASEHFDDLFRSVVDDHLLSDVPIGLFLSAGLDSSALALALAQAGRAGDITAYTLATRGIDPGIDESPAAAKFAANLMMRHRTVPFDTGDLRDTLAHAAAAFDEPQGFSALLTATRIARQTRLGGSGALPGPAVVLAGDGGDEAFGGYAWHSQADHPLALHAFDADDARLAKRPIEHAAIARTLSDPSLSPRERDAAAMSLSRLSYTHRYLCRLFAGFHPAESRTLLGALEPHYDHTTFAEWLAPEDRPDLPHPRRAQRLDIYGFCAGSILPKLDRSAMSVALEVRSPFLDRRILDWSLARPIEHIEGEPGVSKPVLRRFLSRGVEAGLVPREVLTRRKQGFSLKMAQARPFERLAPDLLATSRLLRDGIVRSDYASFLPAYAEAREMRLCTLCMVAAWYEHRASV